MSPEEQWIREKEKLLSWVRFGFAVLAMGVLQFDREQTATFTLLLRVSVYSFSLYSLALLYWHWTKDGDDRETVNLGVVIADIVFATVIVASVRSGNHPFFSLYLVPIVSTSSRYGVKGSLVVAAIITLLHVLAGLAAGRPAAIDSFIMRTGYLFFLAYILGFLSELERRQNQKLALLYKAAGEAAVQDEKRRIARELHDRVLQVLATLKMRSEACRNFFLGKRQELVHELELIENAAENTIKEIRSFLAGKDSQEILAPGNLAEKIEEEIAFLRDTMGMHVSFISDLNNNSFSETTERELYLVLREGILNVARHSQASELEIALVRRDHDGLEGFLKDNGVGFDPEQARSRQGYGLQSMRDRIQTLGGRLSIQTAPGKGTRISFSVPLKLGG